MKVSIITVSFNCASVINDCLNSVASQSYGDIEHLVIDGASSDETLNILQGSKDKLAMLISEPDFGIYDAMNKGLLFATGEIIGFLNSDDFYASDDVISTVADIFTKNPDIEACYANLVYTKQHDTSTMVRYWVSSKFQFGSFLRGWCPPHPTFFVRRTVYERLGYFNLSYRIAADVELMYRFLEVNKIRSLYIPQVWVKMRMGGTTNRNIKNIFIQNMEVIRALRSYGVSVNLTSFIFSKLLSRCRQFFQKSII